MQKRLGRYLGHYLAVATVLGLVSSAALSLDLFDERAERRAVGQSTVAQPAGR